MKNEAKLSIAFLRKPFVSTYLIYNPVLFLQMSAVGNDP